MPSIDVCLHAECSVKCTCVQGALCVFMCAYVISISECYRAVSTVQCQLTWSTDMSSIGICIHVCLQFKFAAPIDMYSVQCACVQLCSVCINVCINVPSIEVCRRQAQYVVHRPGSVPSICAFHLLTYNTTQMITITHHKIFLLINNFRRKKKSPKMTDQQTATYKG